MICVFPTPWSPITHILSRKVSFFSMVNYLCKQVCVIARYAYSYNDITKITHLIYAVDVYIHRIVRSLMWRKFTEFTLLNIWQIEVCKWIDQTKCVCVCVCVCAWVCVCPNKCCMDNTTLTLLHEPCVKYVINYAAASTSSVYHMDDYFCSFKFSWFGKLWRSRGFILSSL